MSGTGVRTLLHVVGARPQFIKLAPLLDALSRRLPTCRNRILHTGQHYDYRMSKLFFDEFRLPPPDHHLEVGSDTHSRQTARILEGVAGVLARQPVDVVVVYGDTNSTLGGALAAAQVGVPVAHVEAGLRSFVKSMPEERNRVVVDHLSTYLFCPSATAVTNLMREGFPACVGSGNAGHSDAVPSDNASGNAVPGDGVPSADRPLVAHTGDVMHDSLRHAVATAARVSTVHADLGLRPQRYDLLTIHRAENTDSLERFAQLVEFVNDTCRGDVVFPVHPRAARAYAACPTRFAERIRLIEPAGYFDALALLMQASRLLTDSGGMQKEAYWLRVPCITLREQTEWPETVQSGWNTLYRDYSAAATLLPSGDPLAYGDGHAADAIAERLGEALGEPRLETRALEEAR